MAIQYYAAQCNAGEYVNVQGFCKPCETGTYCPDGVTQALCNSGSFSGSPGAASCTPCAPGTYQQGRGKTQCDACPDGEFTSGTGQTKCSPCAAGRYGSGAGLRKNNQCTGPCAPGYFCPSGSTTAQQNKCGGLTKFCPSGSSSPTTVSVGHHTTGGDEQTRTGQAESDARNFGLHGISTPCPDNTYALGKKMCSAHRAPWMDAAITSTEKDAVVPQRAPARLARS